MYNNPTIDESLNKCKSGAKEKADKWLFCVLSGSPSSNLIESIWASDWNLSNVKSTQCDFLITQIRVWTFFVSYLSQYSYLQTKSSDTPRKKLPKASSNYRMNISEVSAKMHCKQGQNSV